MASQRERLARAVPKRTATVPDIERLKPSLSKVIVCFRNGETLRYQQGPRTLIPFEFSARFAFPGRQVCGSQWDEDSSKSNVPSYSDSAVASISFRPSPFEAKIDRCHEANASIVGDL